MHHIHEFLRAHTHVFGVISFTKSYTSVFCFISSKVNDGYYNVCKNHDAFLKSCSRPLRTLFILLGPQNSSIV